MVEIRWSLQAADDLDAIVNFIATDSEHYARLVAFHILKAVERLELLPKSGRIVPEINDPLIREILYGNYRIVYRIQDEFVEILAIYHCSRILDTKRILDDE